MEAADNVSRLVPPLIVALTAGVLLFTPTDVLILLIAWFVISVPVGVLIGHCVLTED